MQSVSARVLQRNCGLSAPFRTGLQANRAHAADALGQTPRSWQLLSDRMQAAYLSSSRLAPPLRAADKEGAADALTETLSGLSNSVGRIANTTNMIMGGDNSLESWRELDEKVNQYPTRRSFKAIGTGGQDFVDSMVGAVEAAVGSAVQPSRVQQRPSAKGKYISVTIGPVMMQNSDQVVKVYSEMREDQRLKWYL